MTIVYTTLLLFLSNLFMTYAWYGHLKHTSRALWLTILLSWGIAFFEYILQVPANRIGYRVMNAYQLKILQEAIALVVFIVFAATFLGENLTLRYGLSMVLIGAAVAVAFYK
jgi:uncharacterized protein (DUF486 family)